MPCVDIYNTVVESFYVGTTTVTNPVLIMEVDGVVVPGNYVVQQSGSSTRYIFPSVDSSGNIRIRAVTNIIGTTFPQVTKNINVYVGEVL